MKILSILFSVLMMTACAQTPPVTAPVPPVAQVERPPLPAPSLVQVRKGALAPEANAQSTVSEAPSRQLSVPQGTVPQGTMPGPEPETTPKSEKVWKLKKGKLEGPDQVSPKTISTTADPKSKAVTTTRCWRYPAFAVVESKTTGEVGAGEVNLRRMTGAQKENLCASEFSGKSENLNIIEGSFAGIAGDLVVIEGADVQEGPPQFQFWSVATGKEILKSAHAANEEFVLSQRGKKTSLRFFAKIPVKCELASEGEECWRKVLAQTPLAQPTAMPDCKSPLAKAKLKPEDSVLVLVRAEIADVRTPKVHYVGGKAICQAAPQ